MRYYRRGHINMRTVFMVRTAVVLFCLSLRIDDTVAQGDASSGSGSSTTVGGSNLGTNVSIKPAGIGGDSIINMGKDAGHLPDGSVPGDQQADHSSYNFTSSNHTGNDTEEEHEEEHEEIRFHIATVSFERVSVPFIISMWLVCASVAKMFFHLNKKLSSTFPESCLLIVLGVVVGVALYFSNTTGYELQTDTFFFYLLPPIILEAGYFMPIRSFFDNIGSILCFAVLGTLMNTFLIGFSLYAFTADAIGLIPFRVELLHCLVFSALISAVDPVAVLAVFDEVHVNENLHICVFGESLLNDAVTVVLYHMLETFSHIGRENIITVDILAGIASFFLVGLGGTFFGILFGFLASLMTRFTDHVRVIEPLVVFVMGYLSYLTAEIFHLSGIMACTFCGITMKKYVEVNISRKSHTTIKYFMKMLASLCETIIFMFLGLSTVNDKHSWDTSFVLLTLLFCLIFRALVVIVQCFFINLLRANKLSKVDQFIMAYGGLRGAIAFSLAVLLDPHTFPQKNLMVTTTLVVVYFTVFVQGTTIKPLVRALRVKKSNKRKPTMNEKINDRLIDHMMAGIEDITGHFGHHELRAKFQKLDNLYIKRILLRKDANKFRGMSILTVFQKLNERDANEYLRRKGSFIGDELGNSLKNFNSMFAFMTQAPSANSLSSIGSDNESGGNRTSIPLDNESSTVLDMQALDVRESRKMKDDSKVHHILEDAMFKPRKRFHRHHRHMLPTEPSSANFFHHNIRQNLRHILSHHMRMDDHKRHHSSKVRREDEDKPRKNVSFANAADVESSQMLNCKITKPNDNQDDHSDASSDEGITFTVSKVKDSVEKDLEMTTQRQLHQEVTKGSAATLTETTLPWKNFTTRLAPVSMESIVVINSNNEPCPGEAPSWVANLNYKPQAPSPSPSPVPHSGRLVLNRLHSSDSNMLQDQSTMAGRLDLQGGHLEDGDSVDGRCLTTRSVPHLPLPTDSGPDIVSCSTPNDRLLWTHRIDDFHEPSVHIVSYVDGVDNELPNESSPDKEAVFCEEGVEGTMSGGKLMTTAAEDAQLHSFHTCVEDQDCYLPATWRTRDENLEGQEISNAGDGADDSNGLSESKAKVGSADGARNSSEHNENDGHLAGPCGSGGCDGDGVDSELPPPPWKNHSDSDEEAAQKSNVVFELGTPPPSESACSSVHAVPWETHHQHHHHHHQDTSGPTKPGDVVIHMGDKGDSDSCCVDLSHAVAADSLGMESCGGELDQSSMKCLSTDSAQLDEEDCLPPPWRSVNVSESSLPVRSPSASHELDSLVPQASHNSLRLSEAESRHSEQFRCHHHLIDLGPSRDLEHSNSSSALAAMVIDDGTEDGGQLDLISRVQLWLQATRLDEQEPVPEDTLDYHPLDQHHHHQYPSRPHNHPPHLVETVENTAGSDDDGNLSDLGEEYQDTFL